MKLFSVFFLLFLFGCASDETPRPEVFEIKEIGVLSTTEYTIGKIVKLDDSQYSWTKWGSRKILIKTRAKVKAGVDFSKINKNDIKVKGKTIEIKMPAAEITTFSMDPKYTYTAMESISGLRDGFTQVEKNDFLKQGEDAIRKDLLGTGILKDAEKNATTFLIDFYKQLGYEKVIVTKSKIG